MLRNLSRLTGLDFVSNPPWISVKIIFSLVIVTLVACTISVTQGNVSTRDVISTTVVTQPSPLPSPSPKLTRLKRARVRMSKQTSASATIAAPSVTEFCWYPWKTAWYGDCELASRELPGRLKGPEFCFRSNGTGTFNARARAKDDDKTYMVRFDFSDRAGKLLFRLPAEKGSSGGPTYWTKHIDKSGIWYDWQIDFSFPAQHFYQIYYVNADCLMTAL